MTTHCATCNCSPDQRPPQPSSSSAGIRRMAIQAAEVAVRDAKDKRKKAVEETT